MKISDKVKLIFGFTFFTLLYIFCIYLGLKKQNIDLNKTNKIISIVENRGIDIRYGSKGKIDEVFYIKLENYDKKLGVYRMSKNYEDLIKKINIGDKVKIYFYENSNRTENVNIDLIQVEKKDTILIHKSEFEGKSRFLIYVGIGGIIANIIILVYNRKKFFKPAAVPKRNS
jgi:hypothetical protein